MKKGFIRVEDPFVKVDMAELKSQLEKAKTTSITINNDKFRSLVNGLKKLRDVGNLYL